MQEFFSQVMTQRHMTMQSPPYRAPCFALGTYRNLWRHCGIPIGFGEERNGPSGSSKIFSSWLLGLLNGIEVKLNEVTSGQVITLLNKSLLHFFPKKPSMKELIQQV